MTLLEACEIADKFYKENGFKGITEIWECDEAFAFKCEDDVPFKSNPFFVSKNGAFESKRRYHMFKMGLPPFKYGIEIPEKYKIEAP